MKLLVSVHFIIWVLTFIMSFQTVNCIYNNIDKV